MGWCREGKRNWARFAKEETLRKTEERRSLVVRKFELKAQRDESRANADARAAEIMAVCTEASEGTDTISVLTFNSHLLPVPKYMDFARWMLKNR